MKTKLMALVLLASFFVAEAKAGCKCVALPVANYGIGGAPQYSPTAWYYNEVYAHGYPVTGHIAYSTRSCTEAYYGAWGLCNRIHPYGSGLNVNSNFSVFTIGCTVSGCYPY
jgi:hypothetical protein